jgi:hypothetical protein
MVAPIAGLAPPQLTEVPSMTVWPTIGSTRVGRLVGQLCGIGWGWGFCTLGKLLAIVTIPLSLAVFAWLLVPGAARRYRLTNRRIVVQHGLSGKEVRAIGLDEFDAIEEEVLPGQAWLHCGDLRFLQGGREVFRLASVSRPAVFRQVCLKARTALVSVREVTRQQGRLS